MKRYHFSCLNSTNQWIKDNISTFDELIIVTADEQQQGRGQHGKNWFSPAGYNLYVSFYLPFPCDPLEMTRFMAHALVHILEDKGFNPSIKWPNDVFIDGKKVAGILTECVDNKVIIGIGLNVNMPSEVLKQIDCPATSLLEISQKKWDRNELLDLLQFRFYDNIRAYLSRYNMLDI